MIERFFNRLKEFRCAETRYDKRDDSFLAFVMVAAICVAFGIFAYMIAVFRYTLGIDGLSVTTTAATGHSRLGYVQAASPSDALKIGRIFSARETIDSIQKWQQ